MKDNSTFIGMDVHKNSIDIAIAETGRKGQVRHYGKIDGTLGSLDKVVRKLVSKGNRLHFVYEAGPVDTRSTVTSQPRASIVM
jgi:transposase